MKKALALAACSALLAGCAVVDCGSDWHEVGLNDGRIGAESQVEGYAARCGAQINRERYTEGWEAGRAMRPRIPAM